MTRNYESDGEHIIKLYENYYRNVAEFIALVFRFKIAEFIPELM